MSERAVAKIRVALAGWVREIVGRSEVEVDVSNPTVFGLIETMTKTYGDRFRTQIIDESRKELRVIVVKNDREIEFLQGLATPLQEGDRVMFLPPVAGG